MIVPAAPAYSIVVPVLNEARCLPALLQALASWREQGDEVIVVDGGSTDDTVALARPDADHVITGSRGRAAQMNAGAAVARGRVLWFVHADTLPAPHLRPLLDAALADGSSWGRFDVRLDGGAVYRVIAAAMNLRSRVTGIATGDQGVFVSRDLFDAAGGFPLLPLMEDIELSARLCRHARPACLRGPLTVSSRRWRRHGVARTVLLMWWLRFAWFVGVPAARLARWYGYDLEAGGVGERAPR